MTKEKIKTRRKLRRRPNSQPAEISSRTKQTFPQQLPDTSVSSNDSSKQKKTKNRLQKMNGVRLNGHILICFDKGVQRYFFHDKKKRENVWKLSKEEEKKRFLLMDKRKGEVEEWQISFHYELKRYFFYNHETKESKWVLPVHQHLVNTKYNRLVRGGNEKITGKDIVEYIRESLGENEKEVEGLEKAKVEAKYALSSGKVRSKSFDFDDIFEESSVEEKSSKEENSLEEERERLRHFDSVSLLEQVMAKTRSFAERKSSNTESDESSWSLSDED